MPDIGTLEATLGVRTSPLDKARDALRRFTRDADKQMGQVEDSTKRVDTATHSLSGAFIKLGGVMGAALSVRQIVKFGEAVVQEFGRVEDSIAAAATLFGGVDVDTAALQVRMYELSSATGLAANEIGASLYQALSAGIPVTEDMGAAMGFVGSAAKIAKAGFTDMSTAVEATAKTLNAYRMNVSEAEKIHYILLTTQNRGITTVDDLGRNLAKVTPTAAAFGIAFEEVGAAISVMTAQGIRTEMSTTYLSGVISELGKQGTVAAKALEEAATATGMADTTMKDMVASGMSLGEILNVMADYADRSGKSVMDMFGSIEAGKAVLALTGENAGKFAEVLAEMYTESNLVDESYGTLMDTVNAKIGVLSNNFAIMKSVIGEMLAPAIIYVAERVNDWVVANRELLQQNIEVWAARLAGAVEFIATNMDTILFLVKGLITMKLATWFIAATTAGYGFATALTVAATAAKTLGRVLVYGLIAEGIGMVIDGVRGINKIVENTPVTWKDAALVAGDNFVNGLINAIRVLGYLLPKMVNDMIVQPIAASIKAIFEPENLNLLGKGQGAEYLYQIAKAHSDAAAEVWAGFQEDYNRIANERLVTIADQDTLRRWNAGVQESIATNGWSYTPPDFDDVDIPKVVVPETPYVDFDDLFGDLKNLTESTKDYLGDLKGQWQSYSDSVELAGLEGFARQEREIELWAEHLTQEIKDAGKWSTDISDWIDKVIEKRQELIDIERTQMATAATTDAQTVLNLLADSTRAMREGPKAYREYEAQRAANEELAEWVTLLEEAGVSQDWIDEFTTKWQYWSEANKDAQTAMERWEDIAKSLGDTVSNVFEQMSNQIIDNLLSGKKAFEDFGDFAMQILAQVLKQLVLVSIISPIGSGIENLISGWFPSAHGNAFDSQRNVIPFATGGVVTRPTVFPFARGTGLMGEAGPEAILPLSRINGELGVKAVGGGGRSSVIINVNNQGNPLQMESQTQRDGPDGETIIDISVRSALDRLDGQGALDSMFSRHGSNRKGVR